MNRFLVGLSCSTILLMGASGCTKPGEESSTGSGVEEADSGEGTALLSDCGVVQNGKLQNPVDVGDGVPVEVVSVLGNNLVVVSEIEKPGQQLLKLQGLAGTNDYRRNAAIDRIEDLTRRGALLYRAGKDCNVVVDGGGRGIIGSLVTMDGKNISEDLIVSDLTPVDRNDACGGQLIGSCYAALEDVKNPLVAGQLRSGFLWKPISDHGEKLVVLTDECRTRVFVNNEELVNTGSGNGRCVTARGNKPGSGYGPRPVVKVIDEKTGRPYVFLNGETQLVITNPSARYEF